MSAPIRIGLIGLGSVTQTVHWPVLRDMPDRYRVAAVCDLSSGLRDWARARIPGAAVHDDYRRMLDAGGLDAVAVVNSDEYHADCAVDALAAGYDVMVEKPLTLTLDDIDRITTARDASGRTCMVGYMRRCAGGFEPMRAAIRDMPEIQHVSVRDYIGPNAYFIDQVSTECRPGDLPEAAMKDRAARRLAMTEAALGRTDPVSVRAYQILCGLSSHDLSAMRDLVGAPRGVLGAAIRQDGRQISALLDHGSFTTNFETGLDTVGRFDAFIEVFGGTTRARIDYDTPYIRHLPTTLRLWKTEGEGHSEATVRETFTDPYTRMWRLFDDVLAGRTENPMPPEDSIADLRLFRQIIDAAR
ncbi:Gfo/Idh/MocA family protein [Oceaniglobus trochenteri]|uniref:Gfo/Idh/MocA family protein n=1 Tax=Oceaniglobus trochenteri TaxID=2763260 RepID=UPI001CFFEB15|nr:Gfo/Idh/MocA family oxidoreductase [Oceaniglobus trochenteri]